MNPAEVDIYRDVLEGSVVFRGLAASALDRVIERGMLLEAQTGDLVMLEHTRRVPGLYLVLAGQVEVFRSRESGTGTAEPSEVYLNTLEPGHCFGEYSVIDGKNTSASAKALKPTTLFFLPRVEFLGVTDNDPLTGKTIYRNLLLYLIDRLRNKDNELDVLIMR